MTEDPKETKRRTAARKRRSHGWCVAMGIDPTNKTARHGVESLFAVIESHELRVKHLEETFTKMEVTYASILKRLNQ